MFTKGVIRNLDAVGRIVIPKEYVRQLKLKKGTPIEITCVGEDIILTPRPKEGKYCRICGIGVDLVKINEEYICKNCIKAIGKELGVI